MTTRAFTARVPAPLASRVDELAVSLGRSKSSIVNEALAAWVAQEEQLYQLTLNALADGDAGRTIDHETVRAWVASLTQ